MCLYTKPEATFATRVLLSYPRSPPLDVVHHYYAFSAFIIPMKERRASIIHVAAPC